MMDFRAGYVTKRPRPLPLFILVQVPNLNRLFKHKKMNKLHLQK